MREANGIIGGWLALAGSLGVVLITAIYVTAPVAASVPLPAATPMAEAMTATIAGALSLRLAGTIGIVADLLLIAGSTLLATAAVERIALRLFWVWVALSTALFVGVDGLASSILPALASGADNGAYQLGRGLFDFCFATGVAAFGLAQLSLAFERTLAKLWRVAGGVFGVLSIAAFGLHAVDITLPLLFGASVGVAGIFGALLSWREIRGVAV